MFSNEILCLFMLIVNFGFIILMYRLFGKAGLYGWICIGTIIANIQVVKIIQIFGLTGTLGNITYATLFLATDILSENHGKKAAFTGTALGFCSMIAMTLIMPIMLKYIPSTEDWAQPHLQAIFSLIPRITIGSLLAYAISQSHDVIVYHLIKKRFPEDKWLWLRNNVSTLLSQLWDSLLFTVIAFYGLFPTKVFLSIVLTTYLFKMAIALLDTPFIYIAKWLARFPAYFSSNQ